MARKTSLELLREMSPEKRKQALELIQKMESEPRVLVRGEDGSLFGMPESVHKRYLERKAKEESGN